MLRDARFIAVNDLLNMVRQKETLLWTFLMPPLFFFFIGAVTGGFGAPPSRDAALPIAVVAPADSGFLLDVVLDRLETQGYRPVRFDEEGRPLAANGAGQAPAGGASAEGDQAEPPPLERYSRQLHVAPIPDGHASFTDAVLAGTQVELQFRRTGDELAASYDQIRVGRGIYGVLADLAVVRINDGAVDPAEFDDLASIPRSLVLDVSTAGEREDPPVGFAQSVPGTTVMFTMLIMLTTGSVLLVIERNQGLLRRLASTPISPGSVVLGKWLARTGLGVIQVGYGLIVGALAFGVDWGSSLPVLALVLLAWAGFCASLALLLANHARTEAQMSGLGVLGTMVLAALGGCWWPIEITPAWMQSLALFIPTGWTMDALHKLVTFGYGASAVVPHFLGLGIGALLLGAAAARTFRYE